MSSWTILKLSTTSSHAVMHPPYYHRSPFSRSEPRQQLLPDTLPKPLAPLFRLLQRWPRAPPPLIVCYSTNEGTWFEPTCLSRACGPQRRQADATRLRAAQPAARADYRAAAAALLAAGRLLPH